MNYDFEHTEFTRSLLAGVFAGITAVVLSLIFNVFYRGYTGFSLSEIINVSSVIFALLIVVTIAGIIYYFFHHYIKKGSAVFQLAGLMLTAMLIYGAMHIQRSPDIIIAKEFSFLLSGIIIITAACVIFFIPFLYKRDYL